MIPFWTDSSSLGSPWRAHSPIVAASVSMFTRFKSWHKEKTQRKLKRYLPGQRRIRVYELKDKNCTRGFSKYEGIWAKRTQVLERLSKLCYAGQFNFHSCRQRKWDSAQTTTRASQLLSTCQLKLTILQLIKQKRNKQTKKQRNKQSTSQNDQNERSTEQHQ